MHGLAWLSPEGGFDTWIGAGAKGTDNMRRLNISWDGGNLRERIAGGKRRVAERACLSMGVMLHQKPAFDVLRNRDMCERGYAYRFLTLFPETRIGGKKGPFPRISHRVAEEYRRCVWAMAALPSFTDGAQTTPSAVRLSKGACDIYWEFYNGLQDRIEQGGDLYDIYGWVEKMCQSVIRIAGLLHLADLAPSIGERVYNRVITAEMMQRAVAIGEYLIPHARLAYLGTTDVLSSSTRQHSGPQGTATPQPGTRTDPATTRPSPSDGAAAPVVRTVLDAIVQLVTGDSTGSTFTGTSEMWLKAINGRVPELQRERNWPQTEPALTRRIQRLEIDLRRRGVVFLPTRKKDGRLITFSMPGKVSVKPRTASAPVVKAAAETPKTSATAAARGKSKKSGLPAPVPESTASDEAGPETSREPSPPPIIITDRCKLLNKSWQDVTPDEIPPGSVNAVISDIDWSKPAMKSLGKFVQFCAIVS